MCSSIILGCSNTHCRQPAFNALTLLNLRRANRTIPCSVYIFAELVIPKWSTLWVCNPSLGLTPQSKSLNAVHKSWATLSCQKASTDSVQSRAHPQLKHAYPTCAFLCRLLHGGRYLDRRDVHEGHCTTMTARHVFEQPEPRSKPQAIQ